MIARSEGFEPYENKTNHAPDNTRPPRKAGAVRVAVPPAPFVGPCGGSHGAAGKQQDRQCGHFLF